MADYWGVASIAKRMGVAPNTLLHYHRALGFLMYKRRRPQQKPTWYTNDGLIQTWEISRCLQDRNADQERRARLHNQSEV